MLASGHRHLARFRSSGAWQTKHGRGFFAYMTSHLAAKPGPCGPLGPPTPAPPTPFEAWQTTQSRSTWQLTHEVMFFCASKLWSPGRRLDVAQFGGWKLAPFTPLGLAFATPTRV